MTNYIGVPIETDPTVIAQEVFDQLAIDFPGWLPADGNLDVRLISAFAQEAATTRDLATDVPDTIFQTFGAQFLGVTPILGAGATLSATFTARDSAGYTVPEGTLVVGTDSSGEALFWNVVSDGIIPPASTTVVVQIQSVELGVAVNGTSYLSGQVVLVDDLEFVSSIVTSGSASGGVDPETNDDYNNRLRAELTLLTFRPILPNDFSILAQNVAGVTRATTIDGYDAVANTNGNSRTVTVFVADASGLDPGSTIRTNVDTYLQSLREANFVVYVRAAAYVGFNTAYTVVAAVGVDHTALKASIDAAIADYFLPKNWGQPAFGDTVSWVNQDHVRFSALMAVIQDVTGVDHVSSLTIGGSASDLDLTSGGSVGPVILTTWNPGGTSTGVVT